jgi:hypothetical protein
MERNDILVSTDQTVDLSRNTATRAGYLNRKLSIDVAYALRWQDHAGEGRGAMFGTSTTTEVPPLTADVDGSAGLFDDRLDFVQAHTGPAVLIGRPPPTRCAEVRSQK